MLRMNLIMASLFFSCITLSAMEMDVIDKQIKKLEDERSEVVKTRAQIEQLNDIHMIVHKLRIMLNDQQVSEINNDLESWKTAKKALASKL